MKRLYLTILLMFTVVVSAASQQPYISVKGYVFNLASGFPLAGQTMIISVDSNSSPGYRNKVVTNYQGYYSDSIPFSAGANQVVISVSTYDCSGSMISSIGYAYPDSPDVTLDFRICGNKSTECIALFKVQPVSNDSLAYYCMDGSYSTGGTGNFIYLWNFGDGNTSSEQSVAHKFDKPGLYNVCLQIVNMSDTLCSDSFCLPLQIGGSTPGPCESTFWYYSDSTSNNYVFNGSALNGKAYTWSWDFGDGTTATGQSVSHSFPDANTNYAVCLTTTGSGPDGTMCTSSSCQDIYSNTPFLCESYFWYHPDSTGKYTFDGYAKNRNISSWSWDFGDGTTASGQTVSHTFTSTNFIYTVCLTTTGTGLDSASCSSTSCQEINTYVPSPCESSFRYQADSNGNGYIFEGIAQNNVIFYWYWDFGDGTFASGRETSHSFNSEASVAHNVCLITKGFGPDGDTCVFNSCQEVYLQPPSPCENYFEVNSDGGSVYSFSGNVNSGAQAEYYWDFGDGTSATGQKVTHAFGKIYTTFNICLTTVVPLPGTTGFYQCTSKSCQTLFNGIDTSMCNPVISVIPDSAGNTFRFQNLTQSNYSYFNWNFGDGSQSAESNPVHIYTSPGIYTACLTIADSISNCMNQICQEIWVDMIQPGCSASFTVKQIDSLNSTTPGFMFFNTSAPGYTSRLWSFGDGSISTDFSPIHTYAVHGIYNVCLSIWDSSGTCQSSGCMDIFAGKNSDDYKVTGIVMAGNTAAKNGTVWLISPFNSFYAETTIDSSGTYSFSKVPYGSYYLYAMIDPGSTEFFDFMPTYYPASLSWQGATIITTGEPNGWYPITLITSRYWTKGDAVVAGTIFWSSISKVEGIPASNVEVVLLDSNGSPIAYTFTNSDGDYEFTNLPYGEYFVQAEMTGKTTQVISVLLSESSSAANIDFRINESAIYYQTLNIVNRPKLSAGEPFPNPVNESFSIKINAAVSGSVIIEIIDSQGRGISKESVNISGGMNLINISTSNLAKGMYLLKINTEGYKLIQRRFIK